MIEEPLVFRKPRPWKRRFGWGLRLLLIGSLISGGAAGGFLGYRHAQQTDARLKRIDATLKEQRARLEQGDRTLGSLEESVQDIKANQPPDVPSLVAAVKPSIFTIHVGRSLGSGFVFEIFSDEDGYNTGIITNEHVVHAATFIGGPRVFVSQGDHRIEAKLITWDQENDLALVAIKEYFTPLTWASRRGHTPKEGDFVLAVGSPFGLEGTNTTGIISKLHQDVLQTDAAINVGNSGGPLLNRFGEVLGVNTFGGAQNLNFAFKIELACLEILDC